MEDFSYDDTAQVDQVMGACFLIRRECLEATGMLDERFFMWFEEVDYCFRAKEKGWEVWYTPDATIVHQGGESFAQVTTFKKQYMFSRSAMQYFWKHRRYVDWVIMGISLPFRLLGSGVLPQR